jgi:hypothetical protein
MYKFLKSKCENFCTETARKIFKGDPILLDSGRAYCNISVTYQETREALELIKFIEAREPAYWDQYTMMNY